MLNALSKAFFLTLATNRPLKRLASRYGLRKPTSFARRFIAGETTADAVTAGPPPPAPPAPPLHRRRDPRRRRHGGPRRPGRRPVHQPGSARRERRHTRRGG